MQSIKFTLIKRSNIHNLLHPTRAMKESQYFIAIMIMITLPASFWWQYFANLWPIWPIWSTFVNMFLFVYAPALQRPLWTGLTDDKTTWPTHKLITYVAMWRQTFSICMKLAGSIMKFWLYFVLRVGIGELDVWPLY